MAYTQFTLMVVNKLENIFTFSSLSFLKTNPSHSHFETYSNINRYIPPWYNFYCFSKYCRERNDAENKGILSNLTKFIEINERVHLLQIKKNQLVWTIHDFHISFSLIWFHHTNFFHSNYFILGFPKPFWEIEKYQKSSIKHQLLVLQFS